MSNDQPPPDDGSTAAAERLVAWWQRRYDRLACIVGSMIPSGQVYAEAIEEKEDAWQQVRQHMSAAVLRKHYETPA